MPRRGTTTARGYGYRHRKLRDHIAHQIRNGAPIICWRCNEPIPAGTPWDLGHDDHDRSIYRGPEHIRCNRATAGRRNPKPTRHSRRWL